MKTLKVLFVGESWIKHTIHQKGFDQFHSTEYEEGAGVFLDALEAEFSGPKCQAKVAQEQQTRRERLVKKAGAVA